MDLSDLIHATLAERSAQHLLRSRRVMTHLDAVRVRIGDRTLVNFSSNDYLGLTHHPRMLQVLRDLDAAGAGAAGLISGYTDHHARAEQAIALWKQTDAALLMPSGYQANVAAIQTLAGVAEARGKSVRFLVDKLIHASLIDAIRLTQSPMRVFPHCSLGKGGVDKLARLLEEAPEDELQVVVTESIFSMDGDAADLRAIAALKQRHDFVLLVDEAHGSGVYGEHGAGLVSELGLRDAVDVSVVTLSKALGLSGGAVCASRAFIDACLNFGRAYIYTTSVSPVIASLATEAIAILHDEPERQARVRANAARVRTALGMAGDSPIIPIVLQDESSALARASELEKEGLLVLAVRPPTVPKGTSRLRLTVSSEHTDEQLSHLLSCLQE